MVVGIINGDDKIVLTKYNEELIIQVWNNDSMTSIELLNFQIKDLLIYLTENFGNK